MVTRLTFVLVLLRHEAVSGAARSRGGAAASGAGTSRGGAGAQSSCWGAVQVSNPVQGTLVGGRISSAVTSNQTAAASAPLSRGNLTGRHLRITMIHAENGANMGVGDPGGGSGLRPWQQWTGFFVDQIEWISQRAGFTYELRSPSGDGAQCIRPNGAPHEARTYSGQFNCGANDVQDLNYTDVYWSGYYISPARLQRNLFTVPVISDVGLGLLAAQLSVDDWEYTPSRLSARTSTAFTVFTDGAALCVLQVRPHTVPRLRAARVADHGAHRRRLRRHPLVRRSRRPPAPVCADTARLRAARALPQGTGRTARLHGSRSALPANLLVSPPPPLQLSAH
jgi:hypothetical protein